MEKENEESFGNMSLKRNDGSSWFFCLGPQIETRLTRVRNEESGEEERTVCYYG